MLPLPLKLGPGSDLRRSLEQLAIEQGAAGFVLGVVGNLSRAAFQCAGRSGPTILEGDLEIITLQGTLAPQGVHLHLSFSDGECQVWGGHLEYGTLVLRGADLLVGLLAEAGWTVSDKGLVNAKGEPFTFTILVKDRDQEKIALHYQRTLSAIGITANVRIIDAAQFTSLQNSYDYDMIPATWFNSLSPGNEQVLYYGSDVRTVPGTRNYPGIADPAVDRAIQAMLDAKTREDFVAAVRAEDRLLVSGFYLVPFYDAGGQWVARWNHIGRPDVQPLPGFEATTLWRNK